MSGTTCHFAPGLEPIDGIGPLPAYSVETIEEAEALIVALCSLSVRGRYYFPGVDGELEGLFRAEKAFEEAHRQLRE